MPQVGRWLPGYGFSVWVIKEKKDANGVPYPCAELRDPYNCFPGYYGADQKPVDLSIVRRVPKYALENVYPDFKDVINREAKHEGLNIGGGYASPYTDSYSGSWANSNGQGDLVAEYYNVKLSDLLSKRRSRSVARPRQMSMFLAMSIPFLSTLSLLSFTKSLLIFSDNLYNSFQSISEKESEFCINSTKTLVATSRISFFKKFE